MMERGVTVVRTVSYTCDRCKKPITSRGATKLNISLQKGLKPSEKETFDFCTTCFVKVKAAFFKEVNEPQILEDSSCESVTAKTKETPKKSNNCGDLVTGPIGDEERSLILKLYVEDGLTPEEIGKQIKRVTRGIRRAITKAERTGELKQLKAQYEANEAKEQIREDRSGSGPTNSNIRYDLYTEPAKLKTVGGKIYDVGCILSLYKAGWTIEKIAAERNYDVDVVRIIIENQLPL